MSNDDELFVDGVPLRRPAEGIHWVGEVYPVNADPERDTWNGEPIKGRWSPSGTWLGTEPPPPR